MSMKTYNIMKPIRDDFKHLALAVAMGIGLGAGGSQAQTTYVGGLGTIGEDTLTTVAGVATVPRGGVHWTAAGGEGKVYSHLTSPTLTVPSSGTVTLKFTHRHFFEENWDGGALYVTVNGVGPTYSERRY